MGNELDFAWAAGLIDGEGHVGVRRQHSNAGNEIARPTIVVAMTDELAVRTVHELFGVGSTCEVKPRNPKHKLQWQWCVVSRQAYQVAKLIRPYARTKAKELDEIIDHYEKPETRKLSRPGQVGTNNSGAKLTADQVRSIRSLIGARSQRKIAQEFGVSQKVIANIAHGTAYKNIG